MRDILLLLAIAQIFRLRSMGEKFESFEEDQLKHATFLRKHSVAIDLVDYWGAHPYELMQMNNTPGKSTRDLQYSTNDQYRNMVISFQNNALFAYSNANPSKAAVITYVTSILLPKASSFWSNALKVYPTKSFTVINPVRVSFYSCSNISAATSYRLLSYFFL